MTLIAVVVASLFQAQPRPEPAKPPSAVQEPPKEDLRVLTLGKSRLTIYGFLRLDLFYDTGRPQNAQIPIWILSEDFNPDEGGEDDFSMSARLTRMGFDFEAPAIEPLGNARATAKFEFDLYNLLPGSTTSSAASSNSREFFRLRHAWGKLDWGTFSVLFGQREHVIAPLTPTPNNDMVMWGAGNLGDRTPQLRLEFKHDALTLTGGAMLTGAVDQADLDGNGILDGEASGVPTLQGRALYELAGWVEKRKVNAAVWGHWGLEKVDRAIPGTVVSGGDEFASEGIGADWTVPVTETLTFTGEIFSGKNLDDVRGGNLQGVNTATEEEIHVWGGWIELNVQALPWWRPGIGISLDDPDREDLTTGTARDKNLIWYFTNRARFGPLEIGADYLNWTTEFDAAGIEEGKDHRFNVFFAYHF